MTDTQNSVDEAGAGGGETRNPVSGPLSLEAHRTCAPERRGAARRKLVVEVSASLHQRILAICAVRRIPVNQAVREVLERSFPGK